MTPNKFYKIIAKIKTHTSPLCELTYERVGKFIKETNAFYVFENFKVTKHTVKSIQEVIG